MAKVAADDHNNSSSYYSTGGSSSSDGEDDDGSSIVCSDDDEQQSSDNDDDDSKSHSSNIAEENTEVLICNAPVNDSNTKVVESADVSSTTSVKKQLTPGVIYLSSIPEGMQYNDVYKVFSELGEVGRISLQVGGPQPHHPKLKRYAEGWIEFLDKRKAKRCVLLLNNQLVGGRKRSKWYDCIWHMRYLHRFQWTHLTERLAYEQAAARQRMKTEIGQARQEAHHFAEQIEWKQKELKMATKHGDWKSNKRPYEYIQTSTDEEIKKRKAGSERVKSQTKARSNILGSLFGPSTSKDTS